MSTAVPLLEAAHLTKVFERSRGFLSRSVERVIAVDDVTFSITRGETFGVVGESGCGKTSLARMLTLLAEPSGGSLRFDGRDMLAPDRIDELRAHVQMVFQDPYASLNPRKSVYETLSRPFVLHGRAAGARLRASVAALLDDVGLAPAIHFLDRYPHELSGGQRQRVVIARAIALKPELVIADEPVSALDVSVRAQILNLLKRLHRDYNLTMLFISHDLSVVRAICDRVAVMYLGRIVEIGSAESIFNHPRHPYTRALLASTPAPNPRLMRARREVPIDGEVPSPLARPTGCAFHDRCPMRATGCDVTTPPLRWVSRLQEAACHYAESTP